MRGSGGALGHREAYIHGMSGLEEVFNPGALHATDEMASEKILPAPAPVPGPPLTTDDGYDVIIPRLDELDGDAHAPRRAQASDGTVAGH